MKKSTKNKKETALSVLKEIRDLLKVNKPIEFVSIPENMSTNTVTFPEKTAKEIIQECDNKVGGGKLIYSTWMENEDFYTKEKCRPRTVKIPTEIEMAGKSWNQCNEASAESEMFNFSEIVYMLRESESFRKLLSLNNSVCYTWTNSRDSGGCLVDVGAFGADGAYLGRWRPRLSDSFMGVCFSRS
jgi:hypothetical protein